MIIKKYLPECYKVKKGETLLQICDGFNVNIESVKSINNIKTEVKENDVVFLKTIDKKYYIVKPLDTIFSISKKLNLPVSELMEKNNLKAQSVFIGQKLVYWQICL